MERNDDTNDGRCIIESTATSDWHSSSPQSLIRCVRAALMLASLRARSAEKDDDGNRQMKLRAKRLLADVVMRKRTEMMKVKRLDVVQMVMLAMLAAVVFLVVLRVSFGIV